MPRSAKILIVDDSITYRNKLSEVLEAHGHEVSLAFSAEEAIPEFSKEEFDLVISEIMLPGISGLNMMKIIKEKRPECDVVIISSSASSHNTLKSFRLGAFDFIVKPIDDESIICNVIDRALEKQEQRKNNQNLIIDLTEKNKLLLDSITIQKSLNQICIFLTSTFDTAIILKELTESATKILQARRGYLLLLDKTGLNLKMKVYSGIDSVSTLYFKLPIGKGISGKVVSSCKSVIVKNIFDETFSSGILEEDPDGALLASPSIISVPLQVKGRIAGAITISGGFGGKPFSDVHLEYLSMLSRFASIGIENAGVVYNLKKNHI